MTNSLYLAKCPCYNLYIEKYKIEEKKEEKKPEPEKKAEVKIKEPKVFEVTELEKKVSLDFINNLLVNMGVDATTAFDGSETTGEGGTIEPQTETLSLTAIPRADADGYLHVQTQETTDPAVISAWYTAVPVPTFTP